jgi:CubicO group peptidase (beta-lactamase class C family)
MQRIENKTLEAKDNVGQYLPIFKNTNITIKELLTHTSGLSDSVRPVNAKRSEQSHLSLVQKKATNNKRNKIFAYSDTGFNLLGVVIRTIYYLRFLVLAMKLLFLVLAMKSVLRIIFCCQ